MFYERFEALCVEQGLTVTGYLKKMGWSTSKVTYWKTSPPTPAPKKRGLLSRLLNRLKST